METQIKSWAHELGFDAVGFAPAEPPKTIPQYDTWLADGRHGGMDYLRQHRDFKADPQTLLPKAKSWIVLSHSYDTQEPLSIQGPPDQKTIWGWIARYARGRDYHNVLRKKLKILTKKLEVQFPSEQFRSFVDSGPVLERDIAHRAGLGWIGKNTCLIDEKRGSFFFISEILTTLDLNYGTPPPDRCGTCTKCIDICPTQALISPRYLDARKCISYWTIESDEPAPESLAPKMGNHLFGCDLCQDVCPWNGKARKTLPLPTANASGWIDLKKMDLQIEGTPLARAGLSKLSARAAEILRRWNS